MPDINFPYEGLTSTAYTVGLGSKFSSCRLAVKLCGVEVGSPPSAKERRRRAGNTLYFRTVDI